MISCPCYDPESAYPGLGRAEDRRGRRIRLQRFAGPQGPARGRHPDRPREPQHRDGPDLGRRGRRGVFPAGDAGVRGESHPEGAPGRHPPVLRRPDRAQLRRGPVPQRRPEALRRAGAGNPRGNHHRHGGPRTVRGPARRDRREDHPLPCGDDPRGGPCRRPRGGLSRHHPGGLRPGRARLRLLRGRGPAGRRRHQGLHLLAPGARGEIPARVEGNRIRGGPRPLRQLHHGL